MTGIFFYSILIFILLSIFVPSIYNYAYSCFIGRIVLVLLIVYFSKHNILLGLVFVSIIIVTSMPLYEGFSGEGVLAKNLLVTSNYSIKDKTNNQEVFDHFKKYYCAKNSSSPNQDKLKRWSDIINSGASDRDSIDIASANIMLQDAICSSAPTPTSYLDTNSYSLSQSSGMGSGLSFRKLDNTNCVYGRIPNPGASSDDYKYLGDFDSYELCAQSSNIPSNAKAITYHNNTGGGYARQCYSINDNNTNVSSQNYATCGIVTPAPPVYFTPPPTTDTSRYYQNYNNNWNAAYPIGYSPLYSNVNPRSISGCSYNGDNYVFNMPQCLPESIKTKICDNSVIKSTITSGRNISNNSKLDPYLQQDGQWIQNMYSQLCETSTSPII